MTYVARVRAGRFYTFALAVAGGANVAVILDRDECLSVRRVLSSDVDPSPIPHPEVLRRRLIDTACEHGASEEVWMALGAERAA